MKDERSIKAAVFRMFLLALVLRAGFISVLFLRYGSTDILLLGGDGGFFQKLSEAIYLRPGPDISFAESRFFLGWPMIFGWGNWLGSGRAVMISLTVLFSALVPGIFYMLTEEEELSWLLCFFPPAWLLYSIYPMSEPAYLALGLGSLLLLKPERAFWPGFLMGAMLSVRPYALPLTLAQLLVTGRRGGRSLIRYVAGVILMPLVAGWLNLRMYGDLFRQVRAYSVRLEELNISADAAERLGHPSGHLGIPFVNILITPWKVPTPLWKVLYIYVHLAALLAVLVISFRRMRYWRQFGELETCMFAWFLGGSLLIVSTGPYWGFHSFDRYFLWAWPAMLWIGRDYFRAGFRVRLALLALSVSMAAFAILHHV